MYYNTNMFKRVQCHLPWKLFLNADYSEEWKEIATESGYGENEPTIKTYNNGNTKFYQIFWNKDKVDFKLIGEQLNMQIETISSIKQEPGFCIPPHRDAFYQLKQKYNKKLPGLPVRVNIFAQDWQPGHFLQVENEVITNWKQGEGYVWDSTPLHSSANAGLKSKYTVQVSGFLYG